MIIHGNHYTTYIIVTFNFWQLFFIYIKMGKKTIEDAILIKKLLDKKMPAWQI